MGTTVAGLHLFLPEGAPETYFRKLLEQSYEKLGYRPVEAEEGPSADRLVRLSGIGVGPFVTLHDSQNERLDSGELKELAALLSRATRSVALVASVFDSDRYELVVYARGKQVDVVATPGEPGAPALVTVAERSRARKWSQLFAVDVDSRRLADILASEEPFAESTLERLAELVGLSPSAVVMSDREDARLDGGTTLTLAFRRDPARAPTVTGVPAMDVIHLAEDFPYHAVAPASWPVGADEPRTCEWSVVSRGDAVDRVELRVLAGGDPSCRLESATLGAFKFYQGQVVGPAGPPAPGGGARTIPAGPPDGPGSWRFVFDGLGIPRYSPSSATDILVLIGVRFTLGRGEVTFRAWLEASGCSRSLPEIRFAVVGASWIPLVSGAHPRYPHDETGRDPDLRTHAATVRREVTSQVRRLIHPAVVSSVSILSREESRTLCGLRTLVEGWIGGLEASDGGLVVRTEKRMTSSGSVARKRLEGTVSSLKGGKPWAALFADNSQLQSVLAAFSPPGWDHPALGFGIQTTLAGTSIDLAYIGRSLSEMQGATTDRLAEGETVHVYRWALDHPSVLSLLPGKGPGDPDWNDALATDPGFLQGWIGRSAWIPLMDRADGYELTPYESCSSLDWFRGVLPGDGGLHDAKMTRAWCSRVLRFVSPRLWLGPPLVALVDRAKMEHVAELTELGHGWRVVARAEGDLVALEEALLPVLPVESARVKRSS